MKCEQCGKEFENNYRAPHQRFCSKKCRDNWWWYHRKKNIDRPPPDKRICVICGKEFETIYPFKKCCSDKCSLENKRRRSKDYFYKNISAKPKLEPKVKAETEICRNCGKKFKPERGTAQFCCRACYNEYRKPKPKAQPKTKHPSQLNDLIKQAAECNLDYGTYRGLIAAGKSFEELKVQAATRNPQVHQRTPQRLRGG